MQIPLTEPLRRAIATYRLRSSCPDCRHYLVGSGGCGNGWPNEAQRQSSEALARDPLATELPICKEFELA